MDHSFYTARYKGGYIHTNYSHEKRKEVVFAKLPNHGKTMPANSIRHAKLLISRASK